MNKKFLGIFILALIVVVSAQSNYEILFNRPDITGLTGGGATNLDGIPTTGLAVGTIVIIYDGSETRIYRLTAGTDAENSPTIIRPDDFADPANAKVWKARISSDPTEVGYGGDNLGNHTATQNIVLGTHYLSGDGGNEGVYVNATGKVGIGTASPTNILSFAPEADRTIWIERRTTANFGNTLTIQAGGAQSGGNCLMGGELRLSSGIATGLDYSFISFYTAPAGGCCTFDNIPYERMRLDGAGNLGIGTAFAKNKLDVWGAVVIGSYAGSKTAPTYGLLVEGNVGIGTSSPLLRLDARGTNAKAITAAVEYVVQSASTDAASPLSIQLGIKTDATATNRYGAIKVDESGTARNLALQPSGGNVGIGTTTPYGTLELKAGGDIRADYIGSTGGSGSTLDLAGSQADPSPAQHVVIKAGNVGIGTTIPGQRLEVNGNIKVSGKVIPPQYTNSALPIAYGFVDYDGNLVSGTSNVTTAWVSGSGCYEVTISGESYFYSSYVAIVTPCVSAISPHTWSNGGKLQISFGASAQTAFQFVVYKP